MRADNLEKALESLAQKLEVLIALFGLQVASGPRIGNREKVIALTKAGLTSEDISDILGLHPVTVRQLRSRAKRKIGQTHRKTGL